MKKTEQESVWDYPRPPRLEPSSEHVVVRHGGEVICETTRAYRVLETSHPPTYYLPPEDCRMELFEPVAGSTVCEFKGVAHYADLVVGSKRLSRVAWWYPEPTERFLPIRGHIALYPGRVDECTVDGERVVAQEGDFYGGWITSRVTGPFKGAPGTWGW
ncbi:MAG: DUF427 domain-containing protein [Pontimonas sp.]